MRTDVQTRRGAPRRRVATALLALAVLLAPLGLAPGDAAADPGAPELAAWVDRGALADGIWRSVAFGEDGDGGPLWVAVASSGTRRVMTSTDGVSWTTLASATLDSLDLRSVAFGADGGGQPLWVAVGPGSGQGAVVTSVDGSVWSDAITPSSIPNAIPNGGWQSVAFGGGRWVAVAGSGTDRAMWSDDGTTWTAGKVDGGDPVPTSQWSAVAYKQGGAGEPRWVAVSDNPPGSTGPRVMTSDDGKTWVGLGADAAVDAGVWSSVAYGAGAWVAVGVGGTNRVMTSADGLTWTAPALPTGAGNGFWQAVAFGDGRWVAVASGDVAKRVLTSTDASSWELMDAVAEDRWRAVAYGGEPGAGLWVALASNDDASSRVMTSGTLPAPLPEFGSVVRTPDGFVVPISNFRPDLDGLTVEPTVSPSSATVTLDPDGELEVTGLAPGEEATVTVTVSGDGVSPSSDDVTGAALGAALVPTLSAPVSDVTGFVFEVTNYLDGADFTWTVSAPGSAIAADGTVVVSGLAPGEEATVTVSTTRDGFVSGSASVTGSALPADDDPEGNGGNGGNGGDGGNGDDEEPGPGSDDAAGRSAAPAGPSVTCAPLPPVAGTTLRCEVSGGDPGIELLWRAAFNPVIASAGVTLDADGAGAFSFVVPAGAVGERLSVELVEWLAPLDLGVVLAVAPSPTGVPAGDGPLMLRTRLAAAVTPAVWWPLGAVAGVALMLAGLRPSPAARSRRGGR